jgi:hypothetical protein
VPWCGTLRQCTATPSGILPAVCLACRPGGCRLHLVSWTISQPPSRPRTSGGPDRTGPGRERTRQGRHVQTPNGRRQPNVLVWLSSVHQSASPSFRTLVLHITAKIWNQSLGRDRFVLLRVSSICSFLFLFQRTLKCSKYKGS